MELPGEAPDWRSRDRSGTPEGNAKLHQIGRGEGSGGTWIAANEPSFANPGRANDAIRTRGCACLVRCGRARPVNRRRAGARVGRVVALVAAPVATHSERTRLPSTARRPAARPATCGSGPVARCIPAGAGPRRRSRRGCRPRSRSSSRLRPAQQHLRPTGAPPGGGDTR